MPPKRKDWGDREAFTGTVKGETEEGQCRGMGGGWGDHSVPGPGHGDQGLARAQWKGEFIILAAPDRRDRRRRGGRDRRRILSARPRSDRHRPGGSPRLGGKLAVSEVAGVAVDEGAEALLARRPEGTDLIGAVGLAGRLELPGTTAAGIWTRGRLHPLPKRQLMGVPADLGELQSSGILSDAGLARARDDLRLPATPRDGDVPVGSYVGSRFGRELVDRLVDPLLGGVYAGRSDELSFEATLGGLAQASQHYHSLAAAAESLLPAPGTVACWLRSRRCSPRSAAASGRCRWLSPPSPALPCGPVR